MYLNKVFLFFRKYYYFFFFWLWLRTLLYQGIIIFIFNSSRVKFEPTNILLKNQHTNEYTPHTFT